MEEAVAKKSERIQPHGLAITRKQFFLNVGLLIGLVISLSLWFHRHIQTHTVEGIFVGGTLTLWGLFEAVRACLDWAAEDDMKALPQKILGRQRSSQYLLLGIIASGILHAVTSSINIEYEPTADAKPSYKVEVLYQTNNLPFREPIEVRSDKRIEGRPYFFRFRNVPLRISLQSPRGFQSVDLNFGLASCLRLKVPADFKPKKFHLLRLIPSPKLMALLPETGQNATTEYELEIVRGVLTNLITGLRKQILYIGAGEEDMKIVVEKEKTEARRVEMGDFLAKISFPADGRSAVLELWERNPAFRKTEEYAGDNKIELRVKRKEDGQILLTGTITIEEKNEIQSAFLDIPR